MPETDLESATMYVPEWLTENRPRTAPAGTSTTVTVEFGMGEPTESIEILSMIVPPALGYLFEYQASPPLLRLK